MSKKKAKNGVINIAALDELIAQHGHSPEADFWANEDCWRSGPRRGWSGCSV